MMPQALSKLAALIVAMTPSSVFAMDEAHTGAPATDMAAPDFHRAETAHHGEAASGGLPQFDPSTFASQIFWLAVTFAVLYTIFARKTLPAISSTLENRRMHIDGDLDTAARLREDAAKAQKTYENLLNDARTEATRLLNEAIAESKAHAEKKMKELQAKAAQEVETVGKKLEDGKRRALDDMTSIAAEIASEAAARIVGIKPDISQAQTVVQSLNSKRKAA